MGDYESVVISTRVRLARNIAEVPFPAKLSGSRDSAMKIVNIVKAVCDKLYDYDYYEMDKLSEIDRLALQERHIISPNLAKYIENSGVVVAKDNGVSIMVNEEDHIRAQCVLRGYGLQNAYNKILEFDNSLDKEANIAFDSKLGYLTACPTNLGTAMRASTMVFLPALTHSGEMPRIINAIQKIGLTVRGVYGEGSKSAGYMYQISNQNSIGLTEQSIIDNVAEAVNTLCEKELQARKRWYQSDGIAMEDMVMRAYGILKYARKISSVEFMKYMANVKLGVSLGILSIDFKLLNTLTELAQPANLCHYGGRMLNGDERDELRAKLVREKIESK